MKLGWVEELVLYIGDSGVASPISKCYFYNNLYYKKQKIGGLQIQLGEARRREKEIWGCGCGGSTRKEEGRFMGGMVWV